MDKIFQSALGDPSIKIVTRLNWGAVNPQYKELIYAALDQTLQNHPKYFSSISHAHPEGGFVVSCFPVGFDVEVTDRVTLQLVARICEEKELLEAPDWASLWCAKEATFKALKNFKQPQIVSDLHIEFENKNEKPISIFHLANANKFDAPQGIGATYNSGGLTYCIFIAR